MRKTFLLLFLLTFYTFATTLPLNNAFFSSLYKDLPGETKIANALWWENPETVRFTKREVVIADLKGPGLITMIHFAMPERLKLDRSVIMEIFWDGEKTPSVEVPLVDFFCDPNGTMENVDTVYVDKKRGWNAYFPMPFKKSAKIVLKFDNERIPEGAIYSYTPCYSYVMWRALKTLPRDFLYFHAYWRQEKILLGKRDYIALEAKGKGHIVGLNITVRGVEPGGIGYPVDQNVKFYIDGEPEPSIEWQGMEDAFGFSFGFPEEKTLFFYRGYHPYYKYGAFAYKFLLNDVISFSKSVKVTIGFGKNEHPMFRQMFSNPEHTLEFSSTVYWYQREPHFPLPPLPPYPQRLPTPDTQERAEKETIAKKFRSEGIALSLRCGHPEGDIEFMEDGWDYRWKEGYSFYNPALWPGDVNFCWAGWKQLRFDIICPKGTEGKLRLFIIDPDNFAGGRRQRISVANRTIGTFENFQMGRWVEVGISSEDTKDGIIPVVMENLKEGGNAVVSFVQFLVKK
ncbi:DUF2961 domain-containing protein [bacterium]|nr:DUF2961 domain-containing protein [bacterium]